MQGLGSATFFANHLNPTATDSMQKAVDDRLLFLGRIAQQDGKKAVALALVHFAAVPSIVEQFFEGQMGNKSGLHF